MAEANLGTDPDVFDTNGGGVGDGQEVIIDGTDPLDPTDDLAQGLPTANFTAFPNSGNAPITTWSWNFGDGGSSNEQKPEHVYNTPGTYSVTLTVTNSIGTRMLVRNNFIEVTSLSGIRWIGGTQGEWGNPDNWEGGQVPGENDDVIVEQTTPPVTILVTATTNIGNVAMNNNNLTVTGNNIILRPRGNVSINGILTLENGARIEADRSTSNVMAAGMVNIDNHRIVVRSGGQVNFPNLSSYSFLLDQSPTAFDVAGNSTPLEGNVPSRLLVPMLTTLTYNSGSAGTRVLLILANSNGEIDLSGLTTINTPGTNDRVEIRVASGGSVNVDSVTSTDNLLLTPQSGSSLSLPGIAGAMSNTTVDIQASASLDLPNVTGFSGSTVTVSGAINAPNVASFNNTTLTVNGSGAATFGALTTYTGGAINVRNSAELSMNALMSLGNTNVTVRETATLNMTALTTYSPTSTSTAANTIEIHDTAVLDVPMLANINNLRIVLRAGATLSLPLVTTYSYLLDASPTVFDASGTLPPAQGSLPSRLTLANLTSITYNTGSAGTRTLIIVGQNGGIVDLGALTTAAAGASANDSIIFRTDSNGSLDLDSLISTATLNTIHGQTARFLCRR